VKKSVSPVAAIIVIVVVVVIAVFLFSRAAKTKRQTFVPGVGVIDPETGQPKAPPEARGRGGGGRGGGRGGRR